MLAHLMGIPGNLESELFRCMNLLKVSLLWLSNARRLISICTPLFLNRVSATIVEGSRRP